MAEPYKNRYVQWAKLSGQTKRFDEMALTMKLAAQTHELTAEERNQLADAYRTIIIARRASLVTISTIEGAITNSEKNLQIARQYKEEVAADFTRIAEDVLNLLEVLIPKASTAEGKVFYLTMRGDYYRYLSEIAKPGTKLDTCINNAQNAYQDANDIALKELSPANLIRLGLAFNYTSFYHDILKLPNEAFKMAKQAVAEAKLYVTDQILNLLLHSNDAIEIWLTSLEELVNELRKADNESKDK